MEEKKVPCDGCLLLPICMNRPEINIYLPGGTYTLHHILLKNNCKLIREYLDEASILDRDKKRSYEYIKRKKKIADILINKKVFQ